MINETSFITIIPKDSISIILLKNEAIDRLDSIINNLPKYKKQLEELIVNFTVDNMLCLISIIYQDNDFKTSLYYKVYNKYLEEIQELIVS